MENVLLTERQAPQNSINVRLNIRILWWAFRWQMLSFIEYYFVGGKAVSAPQSHCRNYQVGISDWIAFSREAISWCSDTNEFICKLKSHGKQTRRLAASTLGCIFETVIHAPSAHPWRMKRRLLRAATVRERIRLLTRAALSVYLFSKQKTECLKLLMSSY